MNQPILVFDLDGTLMNSREGILRCIAHALRTLGRDVPDEADLERLIGAPLRQMFVTLLGSGDMADSAVGVFRERYGSEGLYECCLYPGIAEALEVLERESAAMFVATSKPRHYAEQVLAHFGLTRFFRRIYGSEFTGERADKSELLEHLIREETLTPSDVVMIGDRQHDVAAALANGTESIGVLWGYGSAEELRDAGAAHLCVSPAELQQQLATLRVAQNV